MRDRTQKTQKRFPRWWIAFKPRYRETAFLFTSSFVVFGLLFAIGNPPVVAYLLLLDVIWGAVFLCTKRGKNKAFLHSCVGISLASACALCAVKLAWGHSPRYPTIWEGILLGLALLVHLFALRTPETTTAESDLPKLYPRRKYDYERVKMYVTNFSMVGINAPWGTGKSFVVDQLKRDPDFLKEFDLISIDLLTCDLDQVERIIIEELDKVFRKHYIHSAHSFHLKGLMGKNQWSNLLWGILGNEGEGIAASLQGFQKELRKLDKKILLIFDDLDRISETNTTKKIFAIAEKIACDHLHVVYQYDISALLRLGFEIEYLEKYLPYSVTLTQIPYKELVEQQWKDIMPKNISITMKSVQSIGDGLRNCSHFSTLLGLNLRIQMDLDKRTTPRKMENFLTELKEMVATNPVMLKERDLVECVKDSLKGYIDNVTCLQAILDGIDQNSINQALANEYASHIAANERQLAQALEFKARLYENLVTGTINKEEYTDYKAKYTRVAENAKEAIRALKDKLSDVLENRSERNRWISHFTQFSTMETLDRKAVVHMIQSIKVIGKKELEITFTYQDEYQKAIQLIQLAEKTSQRKVG